MAETPLSASKGAMTIEEKDGRDKTFFFFFFLSYFFTINKCL